MVNEAQVQECERALSVQFGPHRGLNSDWCVQAWRVSDDHYGLWVLDGEDGTYGLVRLEDRNDGSSRVVTVARAPAGSLTLLVMVATSLDILDARMGSYLKDKEVGDGG